jgi:hypothetical protein
MINPSDLKLDALPWLPLQEKRAFPKHPVIYFAIDSLNQLNAQPLKFGIYKNEDAINFG